MIKKLRHILLRTLNRLRFDAMQELNDPIQPVKSAEQQSTISSDTRLTGTDLDPTPMTIETPASSDPQDPVTDYQEEMQKYHLRTGLDDCDSTFFPIYETCRKFTMTSGERMYGLYKAIEYIEKAKVEGAMVECGVWRGGSMMIVAQTLMGLNRTNRRLYLFDTFEGLPKPDEDLDVDIWGNRGIDGWRPHQVTDQSSTWALARMDEVQSNLQSTGYPFENIHFIKGMVEDTIPKQSPSTIALLRLDTDWYSSTHHELVHLFPRLSRNGVIIIDDYGHFKGARKAVDDYLAEHNLPILLNRIDYSGRMAIKNF